jgi:hypothetical protein
MLADGLGVHAAVGAIEPGVQLGVGGLGHRTSGLLSGRRSVKPGPCGADSGSLSAVRRGRGANLLTH